MKRALRFAVITLLAVAGSSAVRAQSNPLVGTWKLNLTKSKYDPGPMPKSLTRTVEADGDGVKYTFARSRCRRNAHILRLLRDV